MNSLKLLFPFPRPSLRAGQISLKHELKNRRSGKPKELIKQPFNLDQSHSRVGQETEMCSGSEVGSHSRLKDFIYHSTLCLRVIKKKMKRAMKHDVFHLFVEETLVCLGYFWGEIGRC
jgi:hypothetical protein